MLHYTTSTGRMWTDGQRTDDDRTDEQRTDDDDRTDDGTDGRTDEQRLTKATTGHDGMDGLRTDDDNGTDNGTNERTEDDDGNGGTDTTGRRPRDRYDGTDGLCIYSSNVSNTILGPIF